MYGSGAQNRFIGLLLRMRRSACRGVYCSTRNLNLSSASLPEIVQDELLTRLGVLQEFGPSLGRPNVDTLQGIKLSEYEGAPVQA